MRPNGSRDVHVSTVHFRIPFDLLWSRLTDPLRFPRLYPNWAATVDCEDDLSYLGDGPDEHAFRIHGRRAR
ncbi:MAG: hypothetical protein M3N32_08345 [Actinomycetota bacterium]|nr:hypothetical protein [Actinomycetota bacterium]